MVGDSAIFALERLEHEADELRDQHAMDAAGIESLNRQLDALRAELADANAELKASAERHAKVTGQLDDARSQVVDLRVEIVKAQDDAEYYRADRDRAVAWKETYAAEVDRALPLLKAALRAVDAANEANRGGDDWDTRQDANTAAFDALVEAAREYRGGAKEGESND